MQDDDWQHVEWLMHSNDRFSESSLLLSLLARLAEQGGGSAGVLRLREGLQQQQQQQQQQRRLPATTDPDADADADGRGGSSDVIQALQYVDVGTTHVDRSGAVFLRGSGVRSRRPAGGGT